MVDEKKTQLARPSKTLSILPPVPAKYPVWLDELFLRFAAIYEGKWTYSLQDPRMLELKKAEWFETLECFDAMTIRETVADVKKMPGEFPSIQKFYEVALYKAKLRKAREEMEARERDQASGKILEHQGDPELARKAREEIRKLFTAKLPPREDQIARSDDDPQRYGYQSNDR